MAVRNDILKNFLIIYWLVFLFAIAVIARILFLQFGEGEKWKKQAMNISQRDIIIQANRGDICDTEGRILASSVPFYEIRMDMKADQLSDEIFQDNVDSLSICLADIFSGKSKDQYKKDLQRSFKKGDRNFLVKRDVSYSDFKKVAKFPIFRRGQNKGGFIAIPTYKRKKPFGNLAERTIGYVAESDADSKEVREKIGYNGLEQAYNQDLKGTQGLKLLQKGSGNFWMKVADANEIEPKDGRDIITTIDINLQDVAESALERQLILNDADWGTAILMEVKTGEIKAIANLKRNKDGNYGEDMNYAIAEGVEPGSIFKLPSLIVALEDGYIDLNDTFHVEGGEKTYYNRVMKDSHKGGGRMSVQQIFEHSSNVGVSKIITKYYESQPWKFINRLYSMHLNSPVGLDIKGEARPFIKNPKHKYWSGLSLPWMSVGYELQITPLQILTFYNAVANNGKMVKPRFVKAIREHGQIIKTFDVEILNPSICSQKTIDKAKKMLEGVVERGTATNLKNDHIKIAGKTGTAQISKGAKGYGEGNTHSYRGSFIGYFPVDNPQYSCIVMINNPHGSVYYGGSISGPVFKEIAELVYAKSLDIHEECSPKENLANEDLPFVKNGYRDYLESACKGLKLKYDNSQAKSELVSGKGENSKIKYQSQFASTKDIVPNVVGMGLSDALFLLENKGLKVHVVGKGAVRVQSLNPGLNVSKNDTIRIELI